VTLLRNHLFAADEKCIEAGEIVRRIVANEIVAVALADCQHANNFNRPIRAGAVQDEGELIRYKGMKFG
jgi:hypothetical protein